MEKSNEVINIDENLDKLKLDIENSFEKLNECIDNKKQNQDSILQGEDLRGFKNCVIGYTKALRAFKDFFINELLNRDASLITKNYSNLLQNILEQSDKAYENTRLHFSKEIECDPLNAVYLSFYEVVCYRLRKLSLDVAENQQNILSQQEIYYDTNYCRYIEYSKNLYIKETDIGNKNDPLVNAIIRDENGNYIPVYMGNPFYQKAKQGQGGGKKNNKNKCCCF